MVHNPNHTINHTAPLTWKALLMWVLLGSIVKLRPKSAAGVKRQASAPAQSHNGAVGNEFPCYFTHRAAHPTRNSLKHEAAACSTDTTNG